MLRRDDASGSNPRGPLVSLLVSLAGRLLSLSSRLPGNRTVYPDCRRGHAESSSAMSLPCRTSWVRVPIIRFTKGGRGVSFSKRATRTGSASETASGRQVFEMTSDPGRRRIGPPRIAQFVTVGLILYDTSPTRPRGAGGGARCYWWANAARASCARSAKGSPLTSMTTRWIVPPTNSHGASPANQARLQLGPRAAQAPTHSDVS